MSQVVVGNPTICLDVEEKANFHHLDAIAARLVIVDCDRLKSDLDLRSFQSIEFAYLFGTSEKFQVLYTPNVKVYEVHLADTRGKMSDGRVDHDYESYTMSHRNSQDGFSA